MRLISHLSAKSRRKRDKLVLRVVYQLAYHSGARRSGLPARPVCSLTPADRDLIFDRREAASRQRGDWNRGIGENLGWSFSTHALVCLVVGVNYARAVFLLVQKNAYRQTSAWW